MLKHSLGSHRLAPSKRLLAVGTLDGSEHKNLEDKKGESEYCPQGKNSAERLEEEED